MAKRNEGKSFRKGLRLGALIGAGYMLWNAPQAGARTREQIVETVESFLFSVLDMPTRHGLTVGDHPTEKLPLLDPAPKLQTGSETPAAMHPAS